MNLKLVPCFAFYKESETQKVVGNLLEYMCAETYQHWSRFDKVIRKIIWCSFLPHMVVPFKMRCYGDATRVQGASWRGSWESWAIPATLADLRCFCIFWPPGGRFSPVAGCNIKICKMHQNPTTLKPKYQKNFLAGGTAPSLALYPSAWRPIPS